MLAVFMFAQTNIVLVDMLYTSANMTAHGSKGTPEKILPLAVRKVDANKE